MVCKRSTLVIVSALVGGMTLSQAHAQAPVLPPAPVPVQPGPAGNTSPPAPPPGGAVLGAPSATWSNPQSVPPGPLPIIVPSRPPGFAPIGPPPPVPFQDRNGPLLHGDPILEGAEPPPGWFAEVDIALVGTHFKNSLVAPVTVSGAGTDLVHVPGAELDSTGAPRVGVGYRLPQGFGDILVSYRFLVTEGNDTIANFDALGDAMVRSRLNLNVVDLDYSSRECSLGPLWDLRWQVGARIASVYYDARAIGLFKQERTSNNFLGAGPHAGVEVARKLDVPGLAVFANLDGGLLLGQVSQNFEETFIMGGQLVAGNALSQHRTEAVPVVKFETGLRWTPPGGDHMSFMLGYQFEQWWYLGQVGASRAELTDQGIFFRSQFNF